MTRTTGLGSNRDWEHPWGVKIGTLANPGWSLRIDLLGTPWEASTLALVEIKRSATDWLIYRVEDFQFVGFGGAGNLKELIAAFRGFVGE
jgi:hypothetical protein